MQPGQGGHCRVGAADRRGSTGFAVGMLLLGALAVLGAWREMAHHDGLSLVILSAAVMPVFAALMARRAASRRRP